MSREKPEFAFLANEFVACNDHRKKNFDLIMMLSSPIRHDTQPYVIFILVINTGFYSLCLLQCLVDVKKASVRYVP